MRPRTHLKICFRAKNCRLLAAGVAARGGVTVVTATSGATPAAGKAAVFGRNEVLR